MKQYEKQKVKTIHYLKKRKKGQKKKTNAYQLWIFRHIHHFPGKKVEEEGKGKESWYTRIYRGVRVSTGLTCRVELGNSHFQTDWKIKNIRDPIIIKVKTLICKYIMKPSHMNHNQKKKKMITLFSCSCSSSSTAPIGWFENYKPLSKKGPRQPLFLFFLTCY